MSNTAAPAFFVGHAFTDRKLDDLRSAINDAANAIPNFALKPVYADEVLGTGHIFEKIKFLVAQSFFCIFDITENDRPNIYFELGFAHGIRKPHFLICEEGAKIASDLSGYEFISYRSFKDLKEKLIERIPQMANVAFQVGPKQLIGHVELLGPVLKNLEEKRTPIDELISIAQSGGFTRKDLMQSLQHLAKMGVVGVEDEQYFLKPDGKEFIAMFTRMYPEQASK